MLFGGSTRDIPNLLEPTIEIHFPDSAGFSLGVGRLAIAAGFSLHEDKLNIAFNNGIRLVGFAKKLGTVGDLIGCVGYFMPYDRVQVVKSYPPTDDAYISVKRKYKMSSEITPCHANVSDNTYQPPAGDEYPINMPPDLFQLKKKCLIVLYMAKLIRMFIVPLEIPIGR